MIIFHKLTLFCHVLTAHEAVVWFRKWGTMNPTRDHIEIYRMTQLTKGHHFAMHDLCIARDRSLVVSGPQRRSSSTDVLGQGHIRHQAR